MGAFNYLDKTSEESKSLFIDSINLANYAYHNIDNGLLSGYNKYGFELGLPLTLFNGVFGSSTSQGIFPNIPGNINSDYLSQQKINEAGWYSISANDLNYGGKTNSTGTFLGEKFGYYAAQAEVMGKYGDDGQLIQIGIAFRGTTGPRERIIWDTISDAISDILLGISPEYGLNYPINAFNQLLSDVAEYAISQGLSGEDIIITGHSLGGACVNSLAELSPELYNGFYQNSNFVAFASPSQYESENKVINIGYENDPVFRVLNGDKLMLSSFGIHDKEQVSATNNIVNFNDYYASHFWKFVPTSLVNIFSWISHLPNTYDDGLQRIVNSHWYELTERNSTIIVSNLSDKIRENTWVEDLNRFAKQHLDETFIVGSMGNDNIRTLGGINYIDGLSGNDTYFVNEGINIIHGGAGNNTLTLAKSLAESDIVLAPDGLLYVYDNGENLTIASDITVLNVGNDIFNVTDSDVLNLDGWFFAQGSNDVLISEQHGEVLVSGAGDDKLFISDGGHTLIFNGNFGQDIVHGLEKDDKLIFIAQEEAREGVDYRDYLTVQDNGLLLAFGNNSVFLDNLSFDMLAADQVVIV